MREHACVLMILFGSVGCVCVTPPGGVPGMGVSVAPPPPPPVGPTRPGDDHPPPFVRANGPVDERTADFGPIYRLDFTLSSNDAKSNVPEGTFTMNLQENEVGVLSTGRVIAVPVSTASDKGGAATMRTDVGLSLNESYRMVGGDLLVRSSAEFSGVEDSGVLRKLAAKDEALVTPGKATLVSSIDDASSHKKYQVLVTATKLR